MTHIDEYQMTPGDKAMACNSHGMPLYFLNGRTWRPSIFATDPELEEARVFFAKKNQSERRAR